MNGLQDANTRMELTDRNFCTSDDTQYFHKQTGIATSSRQGVTMSNTNTNNKHRKHNKTTSSCQGLWKRIKEKIRPTHNIHWNCLGPVFFFFLQLLKKRHTDLVFLCVFIFSFFFFLFLLRSWEVCSSPYFIFFFDFCHLFLFCLSGHSTSTPSHTFFFRDQLRSYYFSSFFLLSCPSSPCTIVHHF